MNLKYKPVISTVAPIYDLWCEKNLGHAEKISKNTSSSSTFIKI